MEIYMSGLGSTRAVRAILLATLATNGVTSASARSLVEDSRQQGASAPQRAAAVSGKV